MKPRDAIAIEGYKMPLRKRVRRFFFGVLDGIFLDNEREGSIIDVSNTEKQAMYHFHVTVFKKCEILFSGIVKAKSDKDIRACLANAGHSQSDIYIRDIWV